MSRYPLLVLAGLALLPSACASYHPAPLRKANAVLADPDRAVLCADAAALKRPYLSAQSIDLEAPLTPDALALIALLENPDIKAQRVAVGVTDAQAFAARLLPDPQVQGSIDKLIAGPDPYNAYGTQFALDLSQLRSARVIRQQGEASKRQVRLDLAWAEWQVAGQARLQGVRIAALETQLGLAEQSAQSAEALLTSAMQAASRGDLGGADVDTRRQAALDAGAKLRAVQGDLLTARGELNRLLGLPPHLVLKLAAVSDPRPAPDADALVAKALEQRLDLAALRAGYDSAEASVHKAVLDQFPNLSISMSASRDTSANTTLGPSVGFTLPAWNRNRGGIAIAKATRAQLQAEYEARQFQTRAEITAAVRSLANLRRQKADLLGRMPAIAAFAQSSQLAASHGDLARATALTALQSLRDRQMALAQIDQQIAEQTIALELLSGGLMATGPTASDKLQ
ncbi:TolC family protein [Novosphingobium rosa]|uniref:TolC family protein n=1 Tax=Novosphingobium rosa TaxID=76978 RepID=UPI000AF3F2D8|nr:TolC family protein [Novosphingobium rosa]